MNLELLAKLAGVSVSTVSKAFSDSDEISDVTKRRIFDLAKANGCYDKYNKKRFDKKVIAVICPELKSEYYCAILSMLDKEIRKNNGIVISSITDFSPERETELFSYYSAYCKADGIITVSSHAVIDNIFNTPTVSIYPGSSAFESKNVDFITSDLQQGVRKAVEYLKNLGHRNVGFAGERLTMAKLEMFKNAMRSAGLAVNNSFIKVTDNRFEEAGISAVNELLKQDEKPTAILAAYDYIAIGLIKGLRCEGYKVPEDFSIIGMDDISVIPFLDTPLCSIKCHTDDACRIAVEIIMKKIENCYYSARREIKVESEFVCRGSIAPPKSMEKCENC